jgi:hypothetical protein
LFHYILGYIIIYSPQYQEYILINLFSIIILPFLINLKIFLNNLKKNPINLNFILIFLKKTVTIFGTNQTHRKWRSNDRITTYA